MIHILDEMRRLLQCGELFAVATVLRASGAPGRIGHKMVVRRDGSTLGTIGGGGLEERVTADALQALSRKEGRVETYVLSKKKDGGLDSLCGGTLDVAIEVVPNRPHLLLVGAGHVSRDVARLCRQLEYPFSVLDDRPEMTRPEDWPGAAHVACSDPGSWLAEHDLDAYSHILLLNYDYRHDAAALRSALGRYSGILGMIGSERKRKQLYAELPPEQQALTAKVRCPIGLDIPATSPAEIAVAIMAQIIGDRDPSYRDATSG